MAPTDGSFEEGKHQSVTIVNGNGTLPVRYPSFKVSKPSFNDGGNQCASDVYPLPVKDAVANALDSSLLKGQDVCTISILPEEGNISQQCGPQFTLFGFMKSIFPLKNQMLIDAQLNYQKTQNRINVLLGGTDPYQPCVVDIDVEKGSAESVKSESIHMQKVLQRQGSLSSDKAPTNRWRKYKRAAAFDSRKVVILFSILSSVGTLILIYLTLRVKQTAGDTFTHI